jgi:hypothetical protein
MQAAYLQELQATDPAAVPWVFVRLLAKNGLYRYLTARDRARGPEESEQIAQTVAARPRDWSLANFDAFSIHECECAAVTIFEKIATAHGEDEARRIFKELSKERTNAEKAAQRNNTLLRIYDLPPPLGGNIKRLARQVAAANRYAAEQRVPQAKRFAKGSQDPETVTRHLTRLLERRKKIRG